MCVHRERGGKKEINRSGKMLPVTLGEECINIGYFSFNFAVVNKSFSELRGWDKRNS